MGFELTPYSSLTLQCSPRFFWFSSPDVCPPQLDFSTSSNILYTPPARLPGSSQARVPLLDPASSLRWRPGRVTPCVLVPVSSVLSYLVASSVSTITLEVILTLSLGPTPPLWPGMLTISHSNYQPPAPVAALSRLNPALISGTLYWTRAPTTAT